MNRNTILGLVIIFGIMIGYSLWMKPSKEEKAESQRINDSLMLVQQQRLDSIQAAQALAEIQAAQAAEEEKLEPDEADTPEATTYTDDDLNDLKDKLGIFSNAAIEDTRSYYIENDLFKIEISAKGGKIISVELKDYKTYDSLPLILFDPETVHFGFTFFANNRIINTDELYYKPFLKNNSRSTDDVFTVNGTDNLEFSMRLYADGADSSINPQRYIEYLYKFSGNNYMLDLDINVVGLENAIASNSNFLNLTWDADLRQQEKGIDRFNGSTVYYKYYQDDVEYLSETKDDEESLATRVKWVSYKQRFFCSTLIARNYFSNAELNTFTVEENEGVDKYLRSMRSEIGVPLDLTGNENIKLAFYFGPLKFNTIKKYDLELERQIPLGWSFFLLAWINRYAVIPVFDFLSGFGWNYGIIILVLTILLKIFLLPIAYKTYMSSAKMRVLKPEIEEISQKFPKKEDAMKKQKATMALYKQAGVNPMAGCVPMVLQFPILIALFRFFPASIELRQQSFLWATDLSTYDSVLDLPFNIPFYGDHVSLFTLLMTVSTIIYTRLNNQMMQTGQQVQGMKTMMYLMPIMFLGFFNSYAAALSYYYLLANLITFAQMFLFRRFVNEDKIRAKIMAHKKKPKKKSSFSKRLEDMAKQRGYNPNTGKK